MSNELMTNNKIYEGIKYNIILLLFYKKAFLSWILKYAEVF